MVHEFIWVITESSDGSHEIAREAAKELGGQILEVPRGLYQAWNSGIALASGEFIYIATTGDTITPAGLKALAFCIQKNQADVVFSPPIISPVTGFNLKRSRHWPIFKFAPFLNRYAGGHLPKEKAILIQILSGASGLLGSCASCLFCTSFLQGRPFPTDYHHYGDTAWTYRNLAEANLAFHPDPVAQFQIHDAETPRTVDKHQIYNLIDQLAIQLPLSLTHIIHTYTLASFHIDRIRDPHPKFGWWWMPEAWNARWKRNSAHRSIIQALHQFQ
jgi:glycosyltransferase involved in cell wall biosynthesis